MNDTPKVNFERPKAKITPLTVIVAFVIAYNCACENPGNGICNNYHDGLRSRRNGRRFTQVSQHYTVAVQISEPGGAEC